MYILLRWTFSYQFRIQFGYHQTQCDSAKNQTQITSCWRTHKQNGSEQSLFATHQGINNFYIVSKEHLSVADMIKTMLIKQKHIHVTKDNKSVFNQFCLNKICMPPKRGWQRHVTNINTNWCVDANIKQTSNHTKL